MDAARMDQTCYAGTPMYKHGETYTWMDTLQFLPLQTKTSRISTMPTVQKNERRSSADIQMFRDDNVGKQEYDKCPTE